MEPGPLIGVGRSADVYDVGGGRVLRRYRDPDLSAEREFAVMAWLHAAGFPSPEVFDADGPDLVMERVDGPTLVESLASKPWTITRAGDLLADLHRRLHAFDATELAASGIVGRTAGTGTSIVHLDLHPLNVIVSPRGPIVIDWANVAIGDGAYDVAYVWMVLEIVSLPGSPPERLFNAFGRRLLRHSFLRHFDRDTCAAALVGLVDEGAVSVRNFDHVEMARLLRLVNRLRT